MKKIIQTMTRVLNDVMRFFSSPILPEIRCSREGFRYLIWNDKMVPISDSAVMEITHNALSLSIVLDGHEIASAECSPRWSERAKDALFTQRLAQREKSGVAGFAFIGVFMLVGAYLLSTMRPNDTAYKPVDVSESSFPSLSSESGAFARGVTSASKPLSTEIDLTDNTAPYVESCP